MQLPELYLYPGMEAIRSMKRTRSICSVSSLRFIPSSRKSCLVVSADDTEDVKAELVPVERYCSVLESKS
jgi:hypothetical protein